MSVEIPLDEYSERQVFDPQFDNSGKVHDWRNYVPDHLKTHWHELSEETRRAIIACCDNAACSEEWD